MSQALQKLYDAVLKMDSDLAKQAAQQALNEGTDPVEAIENGLVKGISEVGEKFGRGELFLTDLVMSAEALRAGVAILEPELAKRKIKVKTKGTVVLGTVAGDIHSIGKDIVAVLLYAAGFAVHNIGVDIPADKFIETARAVKADIVGASALLSTTLSQQRKIVEALEKGGLRERVKFMVGGAAVTEAWAKEIGADSWALSGDEAVKEADKIMKRVRHGNYSEQQSEQPS